VAADIGPEITDPMLAAENDTVHTSELKIDLSRTNSPRKSVSNITMPIIIPI